jgi:cytoskeletal protein CcmA (bactofilin family)
MFGSRKTTTTPAVPPTGTPATPTPTPTNAAARPPVGFETVIGPHTTLKGEIQSAANVRIDGKFDGTIALEGNLVVGETAVIHAEVTAHNITISGKIFGNVTGNKVQITRTGRVRGDISAAGLSTEDGAFIEGKIVMANHPAANGEPSGLSLPEVNIIPATPPEDQAGDVVDAEVIDEP